MKSVFTFLAVLGLLLFPAMAFATTISQEQTLVSQATVNSLEAQATAGDTILIHGDDEIRLTQPLDLTKSGVVYIFDTDYNRDGLGKITNSNNLSSVASGVTVRVLLGHDLVGITSSPFMDENFPALPDETMLGQVEFLRYVYDADDLTALTLLSANELALKSAAHGYILADTIDLAESSMQGLNEVFSGIFDGNLKGIKNFSISLFTLNEGFFGRLQSAEIRNLSFQDASITVECLQNSVYSSGILAGSVKGSKITNVTTSGEIIQAETCTAGNVGGVIGRVETADGSAVSVISDLANHATVTGRAGQVTGGVIGKIESNGVGDLDRLTNAGNVIGSNNTGGLIGWWESNLLNDLSNSENSGDVTGEDYTGGIIGRFLTGKVRTSVNSGTVTGQDSVGGLIGFSERAYADNSHNYGDVTAQNVVGGLTGFSANVTSSTNSGNISGISDVGGLAGDLQDRTISKSKNYGTVHSELYTGGLCGRSGYANSSATQISGSLNMGTVSVEYGWAGGICGRSINTEISGTANGGDVLGQGYGADVGGLLGKASSTLLTSVISYGTVICGASATANGVVADIGSGVVVDQALITAKLLGPSGSNVRYILSSQALEDYGRVVFLQHSTENVPSVADAALGVSLADADSLLDWDSELYASWDKTGWQAPGAYTLPGLTEAGIQPVANFELTTDAFREIDFNMISLLGTSEQWNYSVSSPENMVALKRVSEATATVSWNTAVNEGAIVLQAENEINGHVITDTLDLIVFGPWEREELPNQNYGYNLDSHRYLLSQFFEDPSGEELTYAFEVANDLIEVDTSNGEMIVSALGTAGTDTLTIILSGKTYVEVVFNIANGVQNLQEPRLLLQPGFSDTTIAIGDYYEGSDSPLSEVYLLSQFPRISNVTLLKDNEYLDNPSLLIKYDTIGVDTLILRLGDEDENWRSTYFTIVVNAAPEKVKMMNIDMMEGESYTYAVASYFSDEENDSLVLASANECFSLEQTDDNFTVEPLSDECDDLEIEVSDAAGNVKTFSMNVSVSVSLLESAHASANHLRLKYAQGQLYLFAAEPGLNAVQITDLNGKTFWQSSASLNSGWNQLHTAELSEGVWLVRVGSQAGMIFVK